MQAKEWDLLYADREYERGCIFFKLCMVTDFMSENSTVFNILILFTLWKEMVQILVLILQNSNFECILN